MVCAQEMGKMVCAQEPYPIPSGKGPMIAISQDLGLLCCPKWQPDSPSLLLHVPTQQYRKNNPSFPLDQLPNPASHELMSVHSI